MTPDQLAKWETEHAHQTALFAWAAVARWNGFAAANAFGANETLWANLKTNPILPLKWLHAVHNQGHGDAIRGGRAKAEGVKKGIPDIFLPYPVWGPNLELQSIEIKYSGLYIEMKKPSSRPVKETSKGGLSDEQIEFREYARNNGYRWEVAYGWREAAKIIQDYLS